MFWKRNRMIHMEVSDDGRGLPEDLDLNAISSLGLTLVRDLTLQSRFSFSLSSSIFMNE
ncbi:MAG: hypothetical protein KJ908_03980 [Acidobacteria bacterium]|nr:hypothetical protein [Acidobacteriota bacterium]MBU1473928.1 hypothetical protein [Acidobacteriota bacterium]MBU4254206.1 hypothetical protein [Acidobacteriota bacterium]MBU4495086.1 hypothetical protein [Acidobacteriota bacterium]